MIRQAGVKDAQGAVDYLGRRFLRVKMQEADRHALIEFLAGRLDSSSIDSGKSGLETDLRELLHLALSMPEYNWHKENPMTNNSRRDFLRTGFFGMGVGMSMPFVFEHSALAMEADAFHGMEAHPERILVVVEMTGGNDGLNTLAPYRNDKVLQSQANARN
jgi:hypothetical protein